MDHFNRGKLSLSDEVYNQILIKISEKEWKVGEKLPSENQLCKMFGVSRTSVRAALQNLQGSGIIVTMQGVGSFVHKNPMEEEFATGDMTSDLTGTQFRDFFEFRQSIEFGAIDFFVKRATAQEERHLLEQVQKMRVAAKNNDIEVFAKCDFEFHMTVIRGAKNQYFVEAMESNRNNFFHYLYEITRLTPKPLIALAEEHFELYTLLVEKKPKQAREFLKNDNTYYQAAYFSQNK